MLLTMYMVGFGFHNDAWRSANSRAGEIGQLSLIRDMAQAAERARLDAVFFADSYGAKGLRDGNYRGANDGDTAHVETYFQLLVGIAAGSDTTQPPLGISGGRYVDRFECRDGAWRIARRVVVNEYSAALDARDRPNHLLWARRSTQDPSYDRPLESPDRPDQTADSPLQSGPVS